MVMPKNSETGHAINVANFRDLITICTKHGEKYKPSKDSLQLDALNTLYTNANAAINNVNVKAAAASQAIAERDNLFVPLSKLITRIYNAFQTTNASKNDIDNLRTVVRKLQGRRAKAIVPPTPSVEGESMPTPTKTISVSQMSFKSRIENLDRLIEILIAEPSYKPNETELQVTNIQSLKTGLQNADIACTSANIDLQNARIARNNILYFDPINLVKTANEVKTYIKSVFGVNSPESREANSLLIRKLGQ
jgi:hypothetical protein